MSLEIICYRAPDLWNLVPAKIKQSTSLATFKEKRHGTVAIALVLYAKLCYLILLILVLYSLHD